MGVLINLRKPWGEKKRFEPRPGSTFAGLVSRGERENRMCQVKLRIAMGGEDPKNRTDGAGP